MNTARSACLAGLSLLALLPLTLRADQEAGNTVYVQSGPYGHEYAKSIPHQRYGSEGVTRIYQVREGDDRLAYTFNWYAPQIALRGTSKGISIVRFGSWPRGHKATSEELAIAFYLGDKLLKQYSTLDIAGKPDNVGQSVSHYTVIRKVLGYRWIDSNQHAFDIETTDGRVLSFDPDTGEIMRPATQPSKR